MHFTFRINESCFVAGMERKEYRIAAELRRCCWYLIVGMAVLAGVAYWVEPAVLKRPPINVAAGIVSYCLLATAAALPLRWRLRINEEGMSRRLVFRWDLWSWADIGSGRIAKQHPYTLVDPARTRWLRKLRLGYLASGDRREVLDIINEHYQLPPPPDVPESLTIKYAFRRRATFDRNGIHLLISGVPHEYLWRDIRQIHIRRMDAKRRDFRELLIVLPDHEIELKLVTHQGGTTPTWRGATSEVMNEMLIHNVASDRIDTTIVGEPIMNREHIERSLQAAQKTLRDFIICMSICGLALIALLIWTAIDDGILPALAMAALFAVFPGSVVIVFYRRLRQQVAALTSQLDGLTT
jgi:hypothetical protein